MRQKSKKIKPEEVLNALKKASAGDYSAMLGLESENDELGRIVLAVNAVLKKAETGFVQAESMARDAERYRHILDNIEESYFEVDIKGNLLFFNDTVLRDLGYTADEITGINFKNLTDEANAKKVYEAFHHVFQTGRPIKGFDWEIIKKNGETINVEASVALLRDEADRPVGFRGVVRDVSWRIRTQRDLRQSNERYQTLLDITTEGYLEEDLTGRVTFANDAACRLMGYSREQLLGMSYRDYLIPSIADNLKEIFLKAYNSRNPVRLTDYDIVRPDGSTVTYEINAAVKYDHTGTATGFRILLKDFTAKKKAEENRRKSEEKYRNILEIMGEGYIETDTNGVITFLNDTACSLIGYPREELVGKKFDKYSSSETGSYSHQVYQEIYKTGKPKFLMDYGVTAKDGSVRIHQQNAALLTDGAGRPEGFRILVRDVTDHRKAQEALFETESKYRHILETMDEIYLETDLSDNLIFFNDSLCRILGYTREELQNAGYKMISPPENISQRLDDFKEIYATGKTRRFSSHQLIAKDGSVVYLDMTISLLYAKDGAPSGFSGFGRDVTEITLAARKIEENERHLRAITDNISDIIWTMDFDLHWTYLSPSAFNVTGFTPEEIMKMPLKMIIPPDIYHLAREGLDKMMADDSSWPSPQEQKPMTFELPLIHKNGSHIWMEVSIDFNRDGNGRPFEIIGVTRDITERKKAEEKRREHENLYHKALETTSDGVSIIQDGKYVYFNARFLDTLGIPEDHRIDGEELGRLLHPDDRGRIRHYYEKRMRGEPTPGRHELRVIKPDHSIMYLQVTSADIVYQGKPALLSFMQDVTQRKKAEETLRESEKRFRMIVENVHEVICTTDMNLKITYMSPSCYPLSGYTPEELSTLSMEKFMTPETLAETVRVVTQEIERELNGKNTGKYTSRTIEQEIIRKDGSTFWLEGTGSFIRDEQGKATGILLAGRDITERKKAEAERKRLEDQLTQAQKMEVIGRLAGGVAHDFNNMLSVILGYVDLAKLRLAKQHPVLNDIAEIEKAALRSRDITTQLLAFSRKQIIEPRVIDLNGLIGHSQKAMIRLIGEDIRLKVIRPRGLWPVKVDPSQIEQILMNLAVNARDAMPGGGRLTIQTENRVLDKLYCASNPGFIPGEYVCLTVSDSGTGMDKETLKYIFEPFFTTKEVGKGTGLGLATIYGIVKQNEGFINVYSEPGQGASFSIYLPRAREEKEAPDEEEYEHKPSGTGCILLAEDDATVLQIAKEMLESIGYTVIPAASPEEAVACCENPELHIDLVLTDVIMPGMNGSELVKKIRQTRPGMKTLYMSGYTTDVIARHGILERGVMFLQKPFTMKTIADKVAQAMAAEPDS